jgi:tripartite-type tricarboxylate transporter receptor subunit TctC
MKQFSRTFACATLYCAAIAPFVCNAQPETAKNYPTRPIRLLVPFAPGGATDIVARALAPALSDGLGQQVIVDNRAGASGNIAVEIVAKSQPDGHTVLLGNVSTNSINPTTFASVLNFDPVKELTGVTLIATVPNVMVSGMAFPPNSMKELIDYAKARPGRLNYSNPIGAFSQLDMLELMAKTGIKMENIPSKGTGESILGVISGEIHCSFLNAAASTPQIKGGRLKAFVTTAKARLPELPEVPTMAEAGFPGMGSVNWSGFFVPSKTPPAVIAKLYAVTAQVTQRREVQEAFVRAGAPMTISGSPAEFQQFVDYELKRWARIIRENNIRIN